MKGNGGGRESTEEIRSGMPESGGWPVVYGVGNEAGFVGGDVVAEELDRGGWGREVVDMGAGT